MNIKEIRIYIEENDDAGLLPSEIDHVAMCMDDIYKWYHEDRPLGGFLTAVVNNNLSEAVFRADHINIKALKIYALFLMWNLPSNWKEKAKKEK